MAKQRNDAQLWLRQAADAYRFGRLALANEFQQAAEKAVKAVAYHLGMRPVVGHSIHALLKRLNARGRVTEKLLVLGGELDQYYIATRYPDALPGVTPSDAFSGAQARAALRAARRILSWAQAHLRAK